MEFGERQHFDNAGKSREWHTAFFYLAEHVRFLTKGAINHKALYALVGMGGRYVNHDNPLVRKRTAGALSRIVHTKRYAKEMQLRYTQDNQVFGSAAASIVVAVRESRPDSAAVLPSYIQRVCWPDVRAGLENEKAEWRSSLDLFRIDQEMKALFAETEQQTAEADLSTVFIASLLHTIAFGSLEYAFARALVDKRPTGFLTEGGRDESGDSSACLIKFSNMQRSAVMGAWKVTADRPFSIGRYTDCDVVESDEGVSRMHCYVYRRSGVWNFEDLGSSNGSRVLRADGSVAFDSASDGARVPVVLQHGDTIVLAERSVYWFGAIASSGYPTSPL